MLVAKHSQLLICYGHLMACKEVILLRICQDCSFSGLFAHLAQWTDNSFNCFNGLEVMKELTLLFEMIKTNANVFIQVSKGVP